MFKKFTIFLLLWHVKHLIWRICIIKEDNFEYCMNISFFYLTYHITKEHILLNRYLFIIMYCFSDTLHSGLFFSACCMWNYVSPKGLLFDEHHEAFTDIPCKLAALFLSSGFFGDIFEVLFLFYVFGTKTNHFLIK